MATDGLITIPSSDNVKATLDRLESEVKARGVAVFARIDHAAGASGSALGCAVRSLPATSSRVFPTTTR